MNILTDHINLKLELLGVPPVPVSGGNGLNEVIGSLIAQFRQKERLLASHLCPADQRIQTFLYDYLQEVPVPRLPRQTLALDRPGMARLLSLPVNGHEFVSDIIHSYRVKQGVLHNPRSDRRTT